MTNLSPSDTVGLNVRRLRNARHWTMVQLAERCAAVGADWITPAVITNIETGSRKGRSRRPVTVEDLLALSKALSTAPADLLPELDWVSQMAVFEGFDAVISHIQDLKARLEGHAPERPST